MSAKDESKLCKSAFCHNGKMPEKINLKVKWLLLAPSSKSFRQYSHSPAQGDTEIMVGNMQCGRAAYLIQLEGEQRAGEGIGGDKTQTRNRPPGKSYLETSLKHCVFIISLKLPAANVNLNRGRL